MTKEAMFYKKLENKKVRCYLCAQHCKIEEGELGFCRVRQNLGGTLYTKVFGRVIARNVDPIEKKPLYHFLPGSRAYSIATLGCNFRCSFCQNWQISQPEDSSGDENRFGIPLSPKQAVAEAEEQRCESIAYTYTEPTIFFEYAFETAKLAKKAGLRNIFVTNGYMTSQALETIHPYLDAANVDLKAWQDDYYKNNCQARLKPVIKTIEKMHELGIWLEVTTLLIPGENDFRQELEGLTRFLAELDRDIPWHISAFHPAYKFGSRQSTPPETLEQAREIGKNAGLRYIYLGNIPTNNNTFCPHCGETVVERRGGLTSKVRLDNHKCPGCSSEIKGIW
ncbi:MAG: AmmeMemoRadiSam system radical SAM enzyme [Thermodesulfobacteriota bacterium]